MKALIFNSGIGKRMGDLTKNSPKSMVKLLNGETVFERQIRVLKECGIKEFVITTGPFEEQLIEVSKKKEFSDLVFHFVHNDVYDKTNYIYSFYLARHLLNDDVLMLHGDLVFNKNLVIALLNNPHSSVGLINKSIPLPKKDFKGRIINNKLREVGINIFDEDCFTFQPLYKLSKNDLKKWIDNIVVFIEEKHIDQVYAENAFNEISDTLNIVPMSYEGYYINEIDNVEDYNKVSRDIQLIDYQEQEIVFGFDKLIDIINKNKVNKPLVVIDSFLLNSWVKDKLEEITNPVFFNEFNVNPLYEDVVKGIDCFKKNQCDFIISIGGGSAIDTAKAIKMFLPLESNKNYLEQDPVHNNLLHVSVPTTAGTGSESTRYSVIYYQGNKQSLTHDDLVPNVAILDDIFLKTLPLKQKIATVFDALCHSVESLWSVNSIDQSREYAKKALEVIIPNLDNYLSTNDVDNDILIAANNAGKAINISQTTAGHAMSYKITSLFKIPHGIAVALCLPHVYKLIADNKHLTTDPRGEQHIKEIIDLINKLFNCSSDQDTYEKITSLVNQYISVEINPSEEELTTLINSVNPVRLKNYPLSLDKEIIEKVYRKIFNK